jgi:hypothetical protein
MGQKEGINNNRGSAGLRWSRPIGEPGCSWKRSSLLKDRDCRDRGQGMLLRIFVVRKDEGTMLSGF